MTKTALAVDEAKRALAQAEAEQRDSIAALDALRDEYRSKIATAEAEASVHERHVPEALHEVDMKMMAARERLTAAQLNNIAATVRTIAKAHPATASAADDLAQCAEQIATRMSAKAERV